MNQEFIEAYPQGVALSTMQRVFLNAEELALYHQVVLTLNSAHQPSEIHNILTKICEEHFCLTASFNEVEGYKGVRQCPAIVSSNINFENFTYEEQPVETEILLAHPVDICLATSKTLQAVVVTKHDNSPLLVLRLAALTADMNSLLSIVASLNEALENGLTLGEFLQYPQYIEWQQEVIESEEGVEGKAYWQQYVMSKETALKNGHLPYRLPAQLHEQGTTLSVSTELPNATLIALQQCAETFDLSLSNILQSAWWLVVNKIVGENGFVGGWQYDPRSEFEELSGALGVYQQVLPVFVSYEADETLLNWLNTLVETTAQHSQWAESSSDAYDLANILVGFTQSPFINTDLVTLQSTQVNLAHFELLMDVSNSNDAAHVRLHYLSSAYSNQAIKALVKQYVYVLSVFENSLNHSIGSLSLVSSEERKQLLAINSPSTFLKNTQNDQVNKPDSVIERIYHQANNNGDVVALHYNDEKISYKELSLTVDKLAQWLVNQGVSAGDKVALCLPRSAELVIALLATMRVRACYIAVDPNWPVERQNVIYQNSSPKVILCAQTLTVKPSNAFDIATALHESGELTNDTDLITYQDVNKETDVAYVIYTSGSTGVPKGVVIEQKQLSQYCASVSEAVNLADNQHFALTSTMAADLGNTSLFGALYNGGTLHIANDSQLHDGISFQEFLTKNTIDCIKIVPTHLQALLEGTPKYLPKTIILGGEACSTQLLTKLYQLAPLSCIFNHYGPSETTVGVMVHPYKNSHDSSDLIPKLSQVLSGSQVVILNKTKQLCTMGELGQLYIGGNQLAQGYLGQTPDVGFCELSEFEGRWYPSGDLARYLPDGSIGLAGRSDDQIKIRGFRIEPSEVEQGIVNALNVNSALVQATTQGNTSQLIAYVVTNELPQGVLNKEDHTLALQKLRLTLTEAMLPSYIIVLTSWPLLGNGKLDKKSLPPLSTLVNEAFIAPVTPLQTLLANTMAELLAVKKVSTESRFFDLGADSLMVIRFVTRIRKLLLVDIEPGFIFDNASIIQLEKALEAISDDQDRLHKLAKTQLMLAKLSPEQQAQLRKKHVGLS